MPANELNRNERICLARIRARNADMHRHSLEAITKNTPTAVGARIFTDEAWLIKMMDKFTDGKYADDKPATAQQEGGPVLSAQEMGQMSGLSAQIGNEEDSLP